jgi:outer membrane biosynthesis protein TonB
MTKRVTVLTAALLLLLGFAATGCGDDESATGGGDTAADVTTNEPTTAKTGTDAKAERPKQPAERRRAKQPPAAEKRDSDKTTASPTPAPAQLDPAQVVKRCQQTVQRAPYLSAEAKARVGAACARSRSGANEQTRRDICRALIGKYVPEGTSGHDAAIAACE